MNQPELARNLVNPSCEASMVVDERADGLTYTPTDAALDTPVAFLGDAVEQVWRTPEGTYLVPQAFDPVHDSYGNWIVRADGTVLAVATTYAELTPTGQVLQVYGGPFRYYSPEETLINDVFEVVGGALHQYEWYEQERPAPGSLTDVVVREGLVAERRASLPFGSASFVQQF